MAHLRALHFSIKESASGAMTLEMFKGMEIDRFVETVEAGFTRLIEFLDDHCAKVAKDI